MIKGVLVETDLLVEYLLAPVGTVPLLRRLLEVVPCYSTFLQAAEIYGSAREDQERRMVERPLFGLKILGASSRYATTIGAILSSATGSFRYRTAIVAAMAIESGLPIVTDAFLPHLRAIAHLRLVPGEMLRDAPTPQVMTTLLEKEVA